MKIDKIKLIFLLCVFLTISLFSFFLFGMVGIKIFLGIIFVSLPFYFILGNFELEEGELFVFSLMLGITLFPSLVYLIGLLISFRISIILVFLILISAAFGIKKIRNK